MKRLSRLAACLLALTLTACTAAETAVPAATAPPTAAPSPTASPTAAPQATPLPYDDLSYVPEFGFQQKQTYQPDEYNRLYLDTYSFNDRTVLVGAEDETAALLEAGKQRLLIDMSRLEYISSAGLRGILGLVKALKACAGKLAFCSLQPMTAEVFRISGFNAMLTVRDSRQEALAALAG